MSDEHKCPECGRIFDSERGLHIHQSQTHKSDGKSENGDDDTAVKNSSRQEKPANDIPLSIGQALIAVFILGLAVGFSGGFVANSFMNANMLTGSLGSPGTQNSGSPSNNGVVDLKKTDYPYKGLENGVGSGNITTGNTTANVEGDPYLGSPDAPVKMVAYEDFECPFCKTLNVGVRAAMPEVRSNYIETGKVQYYFKTFPLTRIHPWSVKSGVAAECALDQSTDAFWIFKHGFYEQQDALNSAYKQNPDLFDKTMNRWAEQVGLDIQKFSQCYSNQEHISELQADTKQGVAKGVSGTPTAFINGQKIVGAQPYSRFKSVIDSELQ